MSHPVSPAPVQAAPNTALVIGVLVFTAFVMMLNETTLAVALPSIMRDFEVSAATAQWLLTGFMLTMAVIMPTTGWMLDRFSARGVFLTALTSFLIGTVVAAVSPTFAVMLGARVLQGAGTAIIMPLLMSVAMKLIEPSRRGTIMGLISVVMAVGPALGPTVAGGVLSLFGWHMIFWVMVPLVAAAGLIGLWKLPEIGERKDTPLDLPSVVLSVLAFGGLIYGLSSVGIILDGGEAATVAMAVLAVGIVGFVLFVLRQRRLVHSGRALLDLTPFTIRNFTLSLAVMFTLFGSMLGMFNLLPIYLQGSLLVTALVAGLTLLPGGLLEGLLSPIAGRIFDSVGPRPLIIPGIVLIVASLFGLSTVDETTALWFVITCHIVFSGALAFVLTPLMTTALSSLPDNLYGHGSAILNTSLQLAGAAGTAILIAVYSASVEADHLAGESDAAGIADGASTAFLVAAFISVVAAIISLFVQRAETPAQD